MNSSQTSAYLWGKINVLSGKRKITLIFLDIQGSTITEPSAVAEALRNDFGSLVSIDAYDAVFRLRIANKQSSLSNFVIPVLADDILLVAIGHTPRRTRVKAQAAVTAVHKWASSVGFPSLQLKASAATFVTRDTN